MAAAFLTSGAMLEAMSAFRFLIRPGSRGAVGILAPLLLFGPAGAVAVQGSPDAGVEAGGALRSAGAAVTTAPAAPGGGPEDEGTPSPWDPRPALTSLSRFFSEALSGPHVMSMGDGDGNVWYRALASVVFESRAADAMDQPILTDPAPATGDGADPLVHLISTPLRGIVEHLDTERLREEGVSWRMHYGRPSELGRGHRWRPRGRGDALFDDDGSLEPSQVLGVQMKLNW